MMGIKQEALCRDICLVTTSQQDKPGAPVSAIPGAVAEAVTGIMECQHFTHISLLRALLWALLVLSQVRLILPAETWAKLFTCLR